MGFSNFVEVALLVLATSHCALNFLLVEELPSIVFSLMARRLVTATEATVAMVSSLLALDGSFKREGDVDAAVMELRDLEAVFREVWNRSSALCASSDVIPTNPLVGVTASELFTRLMHP